MSELTTRRLYHFPILFVRAALSGFWHIRVSHSDHIFQSPKMIGEIGSHRGRKAQRLVNPHEVVMHGVDRDHRDMVLELL